LAANQTLTPGVFFFPHGLNISAGNIIFAPMPAPAPFPAP